MELKTQEIKKALDTVKPGIAQKEVIEQTTHFAFVGDRVFSYNDELSIQCPIDSMDLNGTINSDELYSFISKVKTETIEVEESDSQLLFKSGKIKCGFVFNKEITLPLDNAEMNEKGKWKSLPEDFVKAIDFVSESCATNNLNPKTICVHVNKKGFVEGTDTHRLSNWKFAEELPIDTVLIPATSIKVIVKFKPSKIASGTGWVHFKNKDNATLSCRIINDKFMETAPILNQTGGIKITFPDGIEEVIDRAQVFAERQNKAMETLEVTVKEKKVILRAESEIGSWFQEIVPMKYSGEGFTFLITPYLLRSIIKSTKNCSVQKDRLWFADKSWTHIAMLKITE